MAYPMRAVYDWAIQKTSSKHSLLWVGLLFFFELFLFVPIDALLLFFSLQNRQKIFSYVALAAITSTFSGLLGYAFGYFLWDLIGSYIVPHLLSTSLFERICSHYIAFEHIAVYLGALLPIPLKAIALSAGICHLPLFPFFFAFLLARLTRFALIGIAVLLFGERLRVFIERHFSKLFLLVLLKMGLPLAFFFFLAQ